MAWQGKPKFDCVQYGLNGNNWGVDVSDKNLDLEQLSFEQALAELEKIVEQMEGNTLALEQSIKVYERGAALAMICQQKLDSASQQVQVLQDNLLRPLTSAEQG